MRVLDRLTGRRLTQLPANLIPSRYSLLERFDFNGHTQLETGDLLSDDGSGVIHCGDTEHLVVVNKQSDDIEADSDLAAEAIIAIADKLVHAKRANVSPMLPSEMASKCELEEIEHCLSEVLRGGHLHSISDRPRRDLRYEELVAPISRARRLATSALSHLASHSDCWQQRTLSGVLPRKVLARFSEDDNSIYENRLYKRLLDRLDRHLVRRLARIRGVNLRLEKALDFQDSEATHFRLRQDICRLWGESYEDDNTGMQLEAGKHALAELESQLRAIRGLQQRGLYRLIPAAAVVPAQVHRTNILNHDPHYRHLPALWEKLKDEREDRQLAPEERFARQQKMERAYSDYVGLVVRRALERHGLSDGTRRWSFRWAGRDFSLEHDANDWVIFDSDGTKLRIVPIAWFGISIGDGEKFEPGRVVCWPGTVTSMPSNLCIPISPLDLYVVEKMGKLIDEWMLRSVLDGYGRKLGPIPTPVKQLTDSWPKQFESVSSTHTRLIGPLDDLQASELQSSLQTFASSQVAISVESAVEQIRLLSKQCGHVALLIPSPPRDFFCQCGTCHATWFLKTVGKKRLFSMRPKGASNFSSTDGFLWSGRDWMDFEIE